MKEELITVINTLKSTDEIGSYDEEATKQAVILKVLYTLGWNIFDRQEVFPEYSLKSQRVDYSLRIKNNNKVFIEVKRISAELESHHEQLLKYSFEAGVSLAILTNGVSWWFYLPLLQDVSWEERKFYTVDLLQQGPEDVAQKFTDFLSRDNISSGKAVENANCIYESQQKKNIIRNTLPKAWNRIISKPEELLVNLLAETTEKLCGHSVDTVLAEQFLSKNKNNLTLQKRPVEKGIRPVGKANLPGTSRTAQIWAYLVNLSPGLKPENVGLLIQIDSKHQHVFEVDWHHPGKELMVLGRSGIHQKPSNAAKEVFGKKILGSYGNIARKSGKFVDTSKSMVIAGYADVERHIRQMKDAGAIVPPPKKALSVTKKAGTYFDSITLHKQRKIHDNILERKELWSVFIEKRSITSTEFKKYSQFKTKGIAGFMHFLTRNGIATRYGDMFTLNDTVIPQIKELLTKY